MNLDYLKRKRAAYVWIYISLGLLGICLLGILFSLMCRAIPATGSEPLTYGHMFQALGGCFSGPLSGSEANIASILSGVWVCIAAIIVAITLGFAISRRVWCAVIGSGLFFLTSVGVALSFLGLDILSRVEGDNSTATIMLVGFLGVFVVAGFTEAIAVMCAFVFDRFSSLQEQTFGEEDDEPEVQASNDEPEEVADEYETYKSDEDEEDFDMNEERLRQIIREELAALKLSPTNIYVTVPPEGNKAPAQAAAQPKAEPAVAPAPAPTAPAVAKEEPAPAPAPVEEPLPVKEEPAPKVEEVKESEPVEEETSEDAIEEVGEENVASSGYDFPINENKRKVPFEEKLANADKELVEKYEGLRDYIISYGIKNRVSIPGDTFSAHRERFAFITITGKKLKVNFALDPKDYENDTIPVETNSSKKFEDLPLTFKIKSDLSYRRALKLVDDVMAKKGISKVSK